MYIEKVYDILKNPNNYKNKIIEIEGFSMSSESYKFIGRYGPGCCTTDGYIYIEYEHDEAMELVDEQDWIKITGTVKLGMDGSTPYVYIDATSVEKMNERGKDTVSN